MTGAGREPGQDSDKLVPAAARVASGPPPPPENATASPGTAAADHDPLALRRSVVSTGVHPLPCRTRTGNMLLTSDSSPFGSALTVAVAVVSAPASTGLPVAFAWRAAVATAACCAAVPSAVADEPLSSGRFPERLAGWRSGHGFPSWDARNAGLAAGPVTVPASAGVSDTARAAAVVAAMIGSFANRPMNLLLSADVLLLPDPGRTSLLSALADD
jgi:hypothetical protein